MNVVELYFYYTGMYKTKDFSRANIKLKKKKLKHSIFKNLGSKYKSQNYVITNTQFNFRCLS